MRSEGLRRQYLAALGVPCLVPRFILPGAAASRGCGPLAVPSQAGAPEAATPERVPALATDQQPLASGAAGGGVSGPAGHTTGPNTDKGAARAAIEALVEPVAARRPPRPAIEVDSSSGTRVEQKVEQRVEQRRDPAQRTRKPAVQFSLTLCRSAGWLVVDRGPAPGRDYLALLANLLHACGRAAAVNGAALQGEAFQWPPPLHRPVQLDTSQAAAAQVLHSRILTLSQRQPVSRILVLGRLPAALLAGMPDLPDTQSLTLATGLWQALAEPQAKRRLWLDLAAAGWL